MFAEEQFLRKKFGDIYDKWSETVGAVIPRFRNFKRPGISFSIRVVLGREYNTFVNIFLIFASLDVVRNYIVTGRIFINTMYAWMLGAAIILWLIIRLIQRYTRWLYVEGR
jgi:protein-S-isoprenylcysteine O-methyltransferase Ste14